jgi:Cro/C1-type HTH DNA-binding domain
VVGAPERVYRLVTSTPQRLNMDVLAALCDILGCGPQDLIEVDAKFDTGIPPMADQYEVILVDRGAWVTPTGARICYTQEGARQLQHDPGQPHRQPAAQQQPGAEHHLQRAHRRHRHVGIHSSVPVMLGCRVQT